MFEHPSYSPKIETVNIVALGPTNADYHAAHFHYNPVVPEADETWTLNKGIRTIRADLAFILDDLAGEVLKSDRYSRDIASYDRPIITTNVDSEVLNLFPDARIYEWPAAEIMDFFGELWLRRQPENQGVELTKEQIRASGMRHAHYFKNSIPMICAYAAFIGVRRINLFGADFDFPGAAMREARRPNAEFWLGACIFGVGMQISLPERSTLLCANESRDIYGYGPRQPNFRLD